ncbi:MAG: sugar ABC transporter permease [Treponema sp.]|jgi:multiple sugar transport system permease protein|nr:sugar ABC transporter permease [Treponema sp.]
MNRRRFPWPGTVPGTLRFPPGLGFVLPGLAGFSVFFIFPFGLSLVYAFMDKPLGGSFVGFSNFTGLFRNPAYLRGLGNTVRFIGISAPLNLAVSLGLALLLNRAGKHRKWFSLVFLIPLVIPSGSMVFFWKTFFSYDGALNGLLRKAGLEKINYLDSNLALPVMILIYGWKNCGYNMVLFLTGLGNIPRDYYEAAWVDNASPLQCFIHVTLPCLLPVSILAFIMSIINSFKIFREIYLITGSYPHESLYTLQHFMNNQFVSLNYPRLTSAAAVLVVIITVLTQFLLRLERRAAR